jgi:hypothetical protein
LRLNPQNGFAAFFFIQNLPRGMLLTVIPLQAYALMGNAQDTSVLLFAVSVGGTVDGGGVLVLSLHTKAAALICLRLLLD